MVDYGLILRIINASDDPAKALEALVDQEREHAAYMAVERPTVYPDMA